MIANPTSPFSKGFLGKITEMITGMSSGSFTENSDSFNQLYSYVSVYAGFGTLTIFIGLIAIILSPFIKKLMAGVEWHRLNILKKIPSQTTIFV